MRINTFYMYYLMPQIKQIVKICNYSTHIEPKYYTVVHKVHSSSIYAVIFLLMLHILFSCLLLVNDKEFETTELQPIQQSDECVFFFFLFFILNKINGFLLNQTQNQSGTHHQP